MAGEVTIGCLSRPYGNLGIRTHRRRRLHGLGEYPNPYPGELPLRDPLPHTNTWFQIIPRRRLYSYASEDEPGDYTTEAAKKMERLVDERWAQWMKRRDEPDGERLSNSMAPSCRPSRVLLTHFREHRTGVHDITIRPTSNFHYGRAWLE